MTKKIIILFFLITLSISGYLIAREEDNKNIITLGSGEHFFLEGLIIKEDETLIVKPGAHLKMGTDTTISVEGKIIAEGEQKNPIVLEAASDYWRGIKINNTNEAPESKNFWNWIRVGDKKREKEFFKNIENGNVFKYCIFKDVSTKGRELTVANKWKSSIEVYNSSVQLIDSKFENILHIGGILTQRSFVLIANNDFTSNLMHKNINLTDNSIGIIYKNKIIQERKENQRCADGIWIKKSAFLITENIINNVGDDAVDIEESYVVFINNEINNSQDDGIDIENNTFAIVTNNVIKGSKDSAFLISDNSKIVATKNKILNSANGLMLRNGAKIVGDNLIIKNNKIGIITFQDTPCILTKKDFFTVKEKISGLTQEQLFDKDFKVIGITTAEELVNDLEKNYEEKGDYYYFKPQKTVKTIQEIFKVVNILDLEQVDDSKINNTEFCLNLKNSFYITDSIIKDNIEDVAFYHEHQIQINNTEFTTEEIKSEIEEQCAKDFECPLVDELNIASTISNNKIIIKKIDKIIK